MRIDFQFDRAAFYFTKLPFTIPYPVPFRILGDERKVRGVGGQREAGWAHGAQLQQVGAACLTMFHSFHCLGRIPERNNTVLSHQHVCDRTCLGPYMLCWLVAAGLD
jgi:hypothetical protein